MKAYDFYLASPFFNEVQRDRESRVKNTLRDAGFTVYAPFEHGVVKMDNSDGAAHRIFMSNVEAIMDSKAVIAIVDENDKGTMWECGFAYGKNIPVYFYVETLGGKKFNIMLSESAEGIITSEEMLRCAAYNKDFSGLKGEGITYE